MPSTDTITEDAAPAATLHELTPSSLQPHPRNPRIDANDVADLADSIQAQGVLHPLVVIPATAKGKYRIIAGHRRHAAAKAAGLKRIPCIVRTDLDDEADQLASMLSENLERHDLTVLEEASAVQGLLDLGDSMAGAAARTGMSKRRISDRAKVAKMSDDLKAKIAEHTLSLEDALFIAKHAEVPEDAEYLDRNAGTPNWHFAKQRITELAAGRRQADKWRAEIADAGLEILGNYGEFNAWQKEHGYSNRSVTESVDWATRSKDTAPSPTNSVIYWMSYERATPTLYTFSDPPSELNDPNTSDPTSGASSSDTEPSADVQARVDAENAAREQADADLATATTVREAFLTDALARGVEDATALQALKMTARYMFAEYDEYDDDTAEVVGIPTSEIVARIDAATSIGWVAMILAFAVRGAATHENFNRPTWFSQTDLEWSELFELMGHQWSDIEQTVLDAARTKGLAADAKSLAEDV